MHCGGIFRRLAAAALTGGLLAGSVVVTAATAEAAVVRPFTLNYDQEVYGDFTEAGNGNMQCPSVAQPVDPGGEPQANCATAMTGTLPTTASGNDAYHMMWADVDSSAATYNSSVAKVTIPPGATVDYARLNWSGDTGTIKLADGTVSTSPACNTRQFNATAGATVPAGTPESTPVRFTVGNRATSAISPLVISRDSLANVPASQPQFYSAYADVTSKFAGVPTGQAVNLTLGNVWAPQGFGCYAGWSVVVVYKYDTINPTYAPGKREVFIYDGHVRQSASDAATTVTVDGFRVGAAGTRVGMTAYEGDRNISGDKFSINGTDIAEPGTGATTNNFFVSNAANSVNPNVVNNMSVDAKEFPSGTTIPVGATSANLTFSTTGDTYLAENLVLSVPIPSLKITKELVDPGPFRPGQQVTFKITVVSPGGSSAVGVGVADPAFADCARTLGNLAADVPSTYTCTGPAPTTSFTNVATANGRNAFGDQMTDQASASGVVINPAVTITKTADKPSYRSGDTITFDVVVRNTGDAALNNVVVADPKTAACATTRPTLAAGDSFSYTCTATAPIAGDSNTATVTATDPLNGTVTATSTAPAPTLGAITGQVFADRNNNGKLDTADGDAGISGVTVTLTGAKADGTPVSLTTTTAADGTYSFDGLGAGTYRVQETQPAAYDDGIDTPGTGATAAGNDAFSVPLASGQTSSGNTFAEIPTSSLAGSVYEDADDNGVRGVGEAGIGGVSVQLTGTDASGHAVSLTATTAADGSYSFPALSPGTYSVAETQPAGYADGKDSAGTAGGTVTPPDSITQITLPARTNATGYLFGEYRGASISGKVVDDAGNPIPNVTVTLTDAAGNPVGTPLKTAADGTYTFGDLAPGRYAVTETQAVGYGDGPDKVGSAGGSNNANDVLSDIVLRSGTVATGYDFTETRSSLAGVVYVDSNNNGTQDQGETGIPGVTVTLSGTDATGAAVSRTTTSGPDGGYVFTGLLSGTYTVTETQPVGYADGKDTAGTAGGTLTGPDSITDVRLPEGTDATGYLFGEFKGSSIAGKVVDDAGNPIPGVTVTLTDAAGNPVGNPVTTGPDGTYSFEGLAPGSYTVTETQPAGYGDGADKVGSAGGVNSANDVISGIVLSSGTTATGYDFAETRSSLAGVVYVDANNNGVQNPGEAGIPDVTVTLTGTDATGRAVNLTTTSGPDGHYAFTGLLGGTYTVTETQPDGYLDGSDTVGSAGGTLTPPDSITAVNLPGGVAATGYLFGEFKGASIAGKVIDDAGNPIPGVTVTLTDSTGNPVGNPVTTKADGTYSFEGLAPGTYAVTETQPVGYADGPDTVGSAGGDGSANDVFSGIPLSSGTAATGYVFSEKRGSLSGVVYVDANDNGTQNPGEAGIPDVTVTLTGTDATGRAVNLTTTSGPDGHYAFTGLLGGTYTVTETQPDGYLDGKDAAGSAGGTVTGPDSITQITLPDGGVATGYLFGEYEGASISGKVVDDAGNPIPGVTVTLTDSTGNPVGNPVTTGPDGTYSFDNLFPGTYAVTETQPVGYGDGPDTVGSAGGDGSANDVFSGIPLSSGTKATGYDFSEKRGSLSGVVYVDANNNGVQNPGEAGIPDVTVTLTGTDATGRAVSVTTTSGPDGHYAFTGLLGGTYSVTETQPDGYLDGKDTPGTAGGTATAPDSITAVTLPDGGVATGYLFGEFKGASISGKVIDDAGNPIPGVTVTLTDAAGNPVGDPVTTKADGTYSFEGLAPGTYAVTETQPPGYGDGPDKVGSAGGVNSANDVISGIPVSSGTTATGYDFAEKRGSLSGVVYVDTNNNGVQDPGETGISDVSVTLTGTNAAGNAVTRTTTSGPDGGYSFTGVVGGTYTVTETQPDGYLDGKDAAGSAGGTVTGPDSVTGIALPGGAEATGYLFGELSAGSIAGRVVDDAGSPIPGVTITLTGTDDTGAAVTRTVTTGDDGSYVVDGLRPGTYTVTETQPDGYGDGPDSVGSAGGENSADDVVSGIVIGSGAKATGYSFAETRGSVAGVVYQDRNDNGAQDAGEPGIGGVTVTLTGTDVLGRAVTLTTKTGPDGQYAFTGVVGGTYTVTETQPDGYADGKDTAGSAGGTVVEPDSITQITLPGGAAATGYDFGEIGGAITGAVWVDLNGDGKIDGNELGRLGGVTVVLLDGSGKELARTTTAADGTYTFPGITAGTYTVHEEQPDGYGSTTPNDVTVTVPAGGGGNADFGERRGTIGDFVWSDTNGNGLQDAGEPGVQGVTVTLLDNTGQVLRTTTTDAGGHYLFTDVPAGTYAVRFTAPEGKTFTVPGKPGDAVNSDADRTTGTTGPIVIGTTADGLTQRTDVDAGLVDRKVDLSMGLTADKPSAVVGDTVVFTGTVTNTGTVAVTGAKTVITVPDGLSVGTVTGDGWDCVTAGQTITCTTDKVLQPGEAAPPITVTTKASKPVASTEASATVTLRDGSPDGNPGNDKATVAIVVTAEPVPTPTPTPAPPAPGQPGPNPPAKGPLAWTGLDLLPQALIGLVLLLAGAGAVVFSNKRRRGTR